MGQSVYPQGQVEVLRPNIHRYIGTELLRIKLLASAAQATTTNYANVTYYPLPYNMVSATLTTESTSTQQMTSL